MTSWFRAQPHNGPVAADLQVMSSPGSPADDRRTQDGLTFDPESRWLSIGRFVQEVDPSGGNRAVLNAYVELTARCRHDRIANVVHVRDADVRALAQALDLKADDLASEIEAVLGESRAEALRTIARMRESRLIGGLAKAATGAVVAGAVVAGGVAVSQVASSPSEPATPVVPTSIREPAATSVADALRGPVATPTSASVAPAADQPTVDGPLTETPDGVGLIPPVNVEADGTTLIPAAEEDRPAD
ncbi:MAG: hypothetical protein KDA94_03320 [Acidimicrobiales bacterium]|nr:hypothetical protein [Acidimicrobiales bacterium]